MNNENQELNNDFVVPSIEPVQIPNELENVETVIEPTQVTQTVVEPVAENVVEEQTTTINPEVTVQPIEEVKIDEEKNINEEVKTEKPKKLPASEKHPKLTTFFLSFFFILLFVYIMAMPYVDEWINKMKENNNESSQDVINQPTSTTKPVVEEKLNKLTCTLVKPPTTDYTETVVEVFEYDKNNNIINSSKTNKYKFTSETESYTNLSKKCTESLKYLGNPGFTISCSNTDLEITIGNEFDLKNFTPIKDGDVTINSNANYKDNIETIKQKLTLSGYICE